MRLMALPLLAMEISASDSRFNKSVLNLYNLADMTLSGASLCMVIENDRNFVSRSRWRLR